MFGERRSSGQARLGCRSCSRRPIRSPRELRRRVRKSKEESIGNGARDTRLLDTRLLSAPADKLQRSNKFRARRHWSAIVSCFVLWRKNRHSAFLRCAGRCRELGRVLTASRPDATNWPDARTPAAQPRVAALDRLWSDALRICPAWSQLCSDPSGGGACESPHSTRGVAIQTTDMMRHSFVLHGSGMMHDSSDGVSNNILLHHAPRFRHAVAQT